MALLQEPSCTLTEIAELMQVCQTDRIRITILYWIKRMVRKSLHVLNPNLFDFIFKRVKSTLNNNRQVQIFFSAFGNKDHHNPFHTHTNFAVIGCCVCFHPTQVLLFFSFQTVTGHKREGGLLKSHGLSETLIVCRNTSDTFTREV